MKNNSRIIQKILVVVLLLTVSITGFYACKKQEVLDPNARYKRELKTYHESQDYKNLLTQYPNANFEDQPIFNANDKLKTIVTNIRSHSGEIIKAMTYFEPEGGFNTWYPTIVIHLTAEQGKDLKSMIDKKSFSGKFEFTTSSNIRLKLVNVVNNKGIYDNNVVYNLNDRLATSTKNSKIMLVDESGGDLGDCLKAADICATQAMKDMGAISLALCVIELPVCIATLYGDCFLHEKACLGIKKPLAI